MKKLLFLSLLIAIFVVTPFFAFSQEIIYPSIPGVAAPQEFLKEVQSQEEILPLFMTYFFHLFLVVSIAVALSVMLYGGFIYIVSSGDPEKRRHGKSWMLSALHGSLIVFASYSLLFTLDSQLVLFQQRGLDKTGTEGKVDLRWEIKNVYYQIPFGLLIEDAILNETAQSKLYDVLNATYKAEDTSNAIEEGSKQLLKIIEKCPDKEPCCGEGGNVNSPSINKNETPEREGKTPSWVIEHGKSFEKKFTIDENPKHTEEFIETENTVTSKTKPTENLGLENYSGASGEFRIPLDSQNVKFSSGYGWRRDPENREEWNFHDGVDLYVPNAESGEVSVIPIRGDGEIIAMWGGGGAGYTVVMYHKDDGNGNPFLVYYSHLHSNPREEHKIGFKANEIGKMGSSGRSTGVNLHLEIRILDKKYKTFADAKSLFPDGVDKRPGKSVDPISGGFLSDRWFSSFTKYPNFLSLFLIEDVYAVQGIQAAGLALNSGYFAEMALLWGTSSPFLKTAAEIAMGRGTQLMAQYGSNAAIASTSALGALSAIAGVFAIPVAASAIIWSTMDEDQKEDARKQIWISQNWQTLNKDLQTGDGPLKIEDNYLFAGNKTYKWNDEKKIFEEAVFTAALNEEGSSKEQTASEKKSSGTTTTEFANENDSPANCSFVTECPPPCRLGGAKQCTGTQQEWVSLLCCCCDEEKEEECGRADEVCDDENPCCEGLTCEDGKCVEEETGCAAGVEQEEPCEDGKELETFERDGTQFYCCEEEEEVDCSQFGEDYVDIGEKSCSDGQMKHGCKEVQDKEGNTIGCCCPEEPFCLEDGCDVAEECPEGTVETDELDGMLCCCEEEEEEECPECPDIAPAVQAKIAEIEEHMAQLAIDLDELLLTKEPIKEDLYQLYKVVMLKSLGYKQIFGYNSLLLEKRYYERGEVVIDTDREVSQIGKYTWDWSRWINNILYRIELGERLIEENDSATFYLRMPESKKIVEDALRLAKEAKANDIQKIGKDIGVTKTQSQNIFQKVFSIITGIFSGPGGKETLAQTNQKKLQEYLDEKNIDPATLSSDELNKIIEDLGIDISQSQSLSVLQRLSPSEFLKCNMEIPIGEVFELTWAHLIELLDTIDEYVEEGKKLIEQQAKMNELARPCDCPCEGDEECPDACGACHLTCDLNAIKAAHQEVLKTREKMREIAAHIELLTDGHFNTPTENLCDPLNEDVRDDEEKVLCAGGGEKLISKHELITRKLNYSRNRFDDCMTRPEHLEDVLEGRMAGKLPFFGPLLEEKGIPRYTKTVVSGSRVNTSDFNWFCCSDSKLEGK